MLRKSTRCKICKKVFVDDEYLIYTSASGSNQRYFHKTCVAALNGYSYSPADFEDKDVVVLNIQTNSVLTEEEMVKLVVAGSGARINVGDEFIPRFQHFEDYSIMSIVRKNMQGLKKTLTHIDWLKISVASRQIKMTAETIDELFFALECCRVMQKKSVYRKIEYLLKAHNEGDAPYQRKERNQSISPNPYKTKKDLDIIQKTNVNQRDGAILELEIFECSEPTAKEIVVPENKIDSTDFLLEVQLLKNKIITMARRNGLEQHQTDFIAIIRYLETNQIISRRLSDEIVFINRNRNRVAHPNTRNDSIIEEYILILLRKVIDEITSL